LVSHRTWSNESRLFRIPGYSTHLRFSMLSPLAARPFGEFQWPTTPFTWRLRRRLIKTGVWNNTSEIFGTFTAKVSVRLRKNISQFPIKRSIKNAIAHPAVLLFEAQSFSLSCSIVSCACRKILWSVFGASVGWIRDCDAQAIFRKTNMRAFLSFLNETKSKQSTNDALTGKVAR
jgi:hypothetical protein